MISYYTITQADVGQPAIRAFGRAHPVSGFLGRILASDVGKRVYQRGGVLQVESDAQRDARLMRAIIEWWPAPRRGGGQKGERQ